MWYINLNGNILPTPYKYHADASAEVRRIKAEMRNVIVYEVLINDWY